MSSFLANRLSDFLDTEIHIGRTDMGLLNRVIMDDVLIMDQQQDTLLRAARLSAKLDFLAILKGKIVINNAQLFGCYVNIYQNNPKGKTNLQFILDAFASKDTTEKKDIDLRINSILIRRGEVRFNKRFVAETPGVFNPSHLHIKQLSTNIALKAFTKDSLNFQVKRLSFREQSGMQLNNLYFKILANKQNANISGLEIHLPETSLTIDSLHATYKNSPRYIGWDKWLSGMRAAVRIDHSFITPNDLACFVPALKGARKPVYIELAGEWIREHALFDYIHLYTSEKELDIQTRLLLSHVRNRNRQGLHASTLSISLDKELIQILPEGIQNKISGIVPFLERAEFVHYKGEIKANRNLLNTNGEIRCSAGAINVNGTFSGTKQFKGNIASRRLELNKILDPKSNLGTLIFNLNINGNLEHKIPLIQAQGVINDFEYNTYDYRNIKIDGKYNQQGFTGNVSMEDPNGTIRINGSINPYLKAPKVNVTVALEDLSPNDLRLSEKFAGMRFSTEIDADFTGLKADDLNGQLSIKDFNMTKEGETHSFGSLNLDWKKKEKQEKSIRLQSDFLQASIEGDFTFKDLILSIKRSISEYMPELAEAPEKKIQDCQLSATVHVQNLDILKHLLGTPVEFGQAAYINASYNSKKSLIQLHVQAPHIIYGSENIKRLNVNYSGSNGFLNGSLSLSREMNKSMVNIGMDTDIRDGILYNDLHWDIPNNKKYSGNISISTAFEKRAEKQVHTIINFRPSEIVINDSVWRVHPAKVEIQPGAVKIENFLIDQSADRYLNIHGAVSGERNDTLVANLKNINLQYVFNIINFHAVEFDGYATGRVYAHDLQEDPTVEAYLNVQPFTFNLAYMGNMNAYGRWKKSERSIYLNALMNDPMESSMTKVEGTITPGHDPGSGLDLNITAENTNLYFLNQYTDGIFTDMQGRTTGNLRVFGPFGGIDLEGDMLVKHARTKVDVLNTYYHMYNNMVNIRPGKIIFKDAIIYDDNGGTQTEGHKAIVNGTLSHSHFSKMEYDIDIKTDRLLAYNQEDFGDELFCGTAIASGRVGIKGAPGVLNVDIDAWPDEHTLFMYNLSRPDVLTENQFVKFVSKNTPNKPHQPLLLDNERIESNEENNNTEKEKETASTKTTSDIRVNFNLHITPKATMRILMDARAGDYISVNGSGNIKASFYNKGKFQMYGTFTVQEGIYKLSLQDVIRKDFILSQGGNIVFGGDPNEAALNLQAIYSVPSVSLNDLSSGSTFSQNNVRVNCLMNIQGKAKQPHISFDLDIPNVNEDEKRMVKSLISTEEEKNMQIVYLLGIGRFYTYDYNNPNQSQSSVAMKSLLSSTLSGQLNEMLSNIIGNNNWNFGTNLSTGEQGWSDMDVEGLLSGRLLNNRLLINGNFGYRDNTNTYKSSNFIGDFDIQWLLTPNGNLSLKAYSETNDRYFTKSSLTTQGIGIQFKKDFNTWKDLFRISRRRQQNLVPTDTLTQKKDTLNTEKGN